MKISILGFFVVVSLLFLFNDAYAQDKVIYRDTVYTIKTYNGGEFTGKIISRDSKEVVVITEDRGEVTIPMYEVKEIILLDGRKTTTLTSYDKRYVKFAKHYLLTNNAFSLPKGENYIAFNLFGPDIQLGVTDYFDIGVITSWYSMPLIINADFSIPVSEKFHIGLGTNVGIISWANLSEGHIFVPNASFTFGSRENNFNISVGYLGLSFEDTSSGKIAFFIGGQRQINQKLCFVIESAVLSFDNNVFGIVIPALRFYTSGNNAWQFGFAAIFGGDDISGIPFPSIQYMWNM